MAGRKKGSPSQSAFIREKLAADPKLNLAEINEAWKAEHKSGQISPTLFYQVKSKAGIVRTGGGKRRGRPPKAASNHAVPRSGGYHAIEQKLDELVGTAESLGDSSLANSLRVTRRLVSAKLI